MIRGYHHFRKRPYCILAVSAGTSPKITRRSVQNSNHRSSKSTATGKPPVVWLFVVGNSAREFKTTTTFGPERNFWNGIRLRFGGFRFLTLLTGVFCASHIIHTGFLFIMNMEQPFNLPGNLNAWKHICWFVVVSSWKTVTKMQLDQAILSSCGNCIKMMT